MGYGESQAYEDTTSHGLGRAIRERWHVIIDGVAPGVYLGEHAARLGVGTTGGREIQVFGRRDDANALFVDAFMRGEVIRRA